MTTGTPSRSVIASGFRRFLRVAAVLLFVAVIGFGAAFAHWDYVECRFNTITPGAVYCSAAMAPERLVKTVHKYGIKTVIDFRNPGKEESDSVDAVMMEDKALAAIGVRHVRVPSDQIPSDDTVKLFLEVMSDPINRPVLMHCHHGEGRAVLFSALYRIEFEHWSPDHARRATKMIIFPGSTFATDGPKGQYLLGYKSRMLSATNAPTPQDENN